MRRTTNAARGGAAGLAVALLALAALLCGCAGDSPARTPADGGRVPPSASAPASTTAAAPSVTAPPPGAARALPRSVPVRLRIPALGLDTSVMALGLAADGSVRVPPIEAHSPAGWYDGSPTPGQTGPAVILGHVTVGAYGDGVFRHLSSLRDGDRVLVGRQDGTVAMFTVERVQTVAKSKFPASEVYGNVSHPALRLITCGGTKVTGGGGYPDNVIVYASLVNGS